jgi:hypothetical protein
MVPDEQTSFKNFFATGPIHELLEKPGQLRYSGWDLNTQDRVRIVKGEYLEVKASTRKSLQLYEDGSLIVRVSAGPDYLSWGQDEDVFENNPRLNPLALVEFTLNFTILCSRLVPHLAPRPQTISMLLEIQNAFLQNGKKLYLGAGRLSRMGFNSGERRDAPAPTVRRDIRETTADVEQRHAEVAYRLVAKIYNWFGHPNNNIPYVSTRANGSAFIDADQIINATAD